MTALLAAGAMAGSAQAMQSYKWKKRPVLVFAPDAGDKRLNEQRIAVNAAQEGYSERDIVVVYVVAGAVNAEPGAAGPGVSAESLRKRYGVGAGEFKVVLVGKDGGGKLSTAAPLGTALLFRTIDAMPMRAQEMRRR